RHGWLKSLIKLYAGSYRLYVNYYGPPRTITTIPYYRALQLGETTDRGTPIDLKGKAVFVGLSEKLPAERKYSCYTVFPQANGLFISGVEIAATAFLNMLEDTPVKPIDSRYYILMIHIWGMLIDVVCRMTSMVVGASVVIGLSFNYLTAEVYQF